MVRRTDRPAMTIAVDLGRKATKQTNKIISFSWRIFRKIWKNKQSGKINKSNPLCKLNPQSRNPVPAPEKAKKNSADPGQTTSLEAA